MLDVSKRVSSPVLIGRAAEVSVLTEALEQATAGAPRCVLVAGEAGVGKSRLLEALTDHARARDVRALVGGCIELSEGHLPFAPVAQALRSFVQEIGADAVRDIVGPAGDELARVIPELGEPVEFGAKGNVVFDSSQGRLFEAILRVLGRVAEESGLLLVFEDLHWADDSTRDVISFLIRNMAKEKLLLVATYRSDELHRQHPMRSFLTSLPSTVERLNLRRLDRAEVRDQLNQIRGEAPDEALVDRVFERSDGNPFFAEELIAALGEDVGVGLPETLRDALIVRIEKLSPAAQDVLRVASVAGRQVDHRLLAAVMMTDENDLISALREAVSHQLLVPAAGDSYSFRHALMREATYGDLLSGERTRLHATFASVLGERRGLAGGAGAAAAAELAYHCFAAHDLEAALVASVEAGRSALEALAFSESRRHFERALELWEQVPDAPSKAGIDHFGLLTSSGHAALLAGDAEKATSLFRDALDLVDVDEDPVEAGLLHVRIARAMWTAGHSEAALAEYKRAVEILPPEPPSAARANVLAGEAQILMLSSRFSESRNRCEEAIAIARQVGAREQEGHALNTLGVDVAFLGDPERGVEYMLEARAIAEEVGNVDDIARTYPNLESLLALGAGRLSDAAQVCREGIDRMRQLGLERSYGYWLMSDLATILARMGEWDEAERVIAGIGHTGIAQIRAFAHLAAAHIAIGRGHFEQASQELASVQDIARRVVDPQFQAPYTQLRVQLGLWENRHEDALATAEEGMRLLQDTDDVGELAYLCWLALRAIADSAEIMATKDGLEDARRRGEVLRDRAAELGKRARVNDKVFNPGAVASAASAAAEWSRLIATADPDAWANAAVLWSDIEQRFEVAYAKWREAEFAVTLKDKPRASGALQEALKIAQGLRAEPLERELEALARRARLDLTPSDEADVDVPRDASSDFGLTARELEVLRLVAEGKTNPQIASELFISEKTASVHVSHILAKLGVSGRVEAAGVAHRLGL